MSKQKFKKGDNILVIKGIHAGMRGVISYCYKHNDGRVRYLVTFKSFKAYLYSYQMKPYDIEDESASIKHTVESTDKSVKSKLKPGMCVKLSKQGLAKIAVYGTAISSHSYEWARNHNFHTIGRVDTFEGINFYTLAGFDNAYHFTESDFAESNLLCDKYSVGEKVRFTRETLVKLGIELSEYYGNDTVNKLPQRLTDTRKVLSIGHTNGKALYQLDGECYGKFFYEHEIELAND